MQVSIRRLRLLSFLSPLVSSTLALTLACTTSPSDDATDDDDSSDEGDDDDDQGDDDDNDDDGNSSDDDDDDGASTDNDDDDDASTDDDDDDDDDDDSGDDDDDDDDSGDDDDDDGTTTSGDDSGSTGTDDEPVGIFVTPNLDDDNSDGSPDFDDGYFADDDDVAPYALDFLIADHTYTVAVSGQDDALKIWVDGKGWMNENGAVTASFEFKAGSKPLTLQVSMGDYNAKAKLVFTDQDEVRAAVEVPVQASPLILNHHLQRSESVHMVDVGSNQAMVAGYEEVLGPSFSAFSGGAYGDDVWLQDEIEFATLTGMNGARIDVVINSIRDRGLDPVAKNEFAGNQGRSPNWLMGIWGSGTAESGDSFGNLEVSPPVTVGGVHYPFGRIYFGDREHGKLNDELASFLESQEIQKPFTLDTSWLCVGHVDEFISFIPDTSSPKGFKMLYADTRVGYEWVKGFDANVNLDRYSQAHGVATIGDLASNSSLKSINDALQSDTLDPILAQLKKELELSDDDVILFPSIFEEVSGCRGSGQMITLIPGTVNLIVGWKDDKTAQLFMPDPFMRSSGSSQDNDPFIQATRELLPADLDTYFLDDWQDYHVAHGEVHCGSNVIRTPKDSWWKSGLHLLK